MYVTKFQNKSDYIELPICNIYVNIYKCSYMYVYIYDICKYI